MERNVCRKPAPGRGGEVGKGDCAAGQEVVVDDHLGEARHNALHNDDPGVPA